MGAHKVDARPFAEWLESMVERHGIAATIRMLGWPDTASSRTKLRAWRGRPRLPAFEMALALRAAGSSFGKVYAGPEHEWIRLFVAELVAIGLGPPKWIDRPIGTQRRMTNDQVIAAHRVYVATGMSLQTLADEIFSQFGYASAKTCAAALHRAFASLGLPRRSRAAANTRHGRATREHQINNTLEYRQVRRAGKVRRGEILERPRCAARRSRKPHEQCGNLAQAGRSWCRVHDPDRAGEVRDGIRAARDRRPV